MAEVFLRQNQIAGFLRTTMCTTKMRLLMAEVFLRQLAGFLRTRNSGARTKTVIGRRWLKIMR